MSEMDQLCDKAHDEDTTFQETFSATFQTGLLA